MADKYDASSPAAPWLTLLIVALVIVVLYYAQEVLLPLALAVLLSFVLTPLVTRLERWRLGRIPSVVVVVLLTCSVIGAVGLLATGQVVELGIQLPEYKANLIERIRSVRNGTGGTLKEARQAIDDISAELTADSEDAPRPTLKETWLSWLGTNTEPRSKEAGAVAVKVVELPPSPLTQIRSWFGPLVAPLSTAGIVFVLVFFILVNREDSRNRIIRLIGTSTLYATTEAIDDVETSRLAEDYLKSVDWIELYDRVVIPALQLAERDRHAGLLSERQETLVIETAQELIEDLGERQLELARQSAAAEAPGGMGDKAAARVFCVPVRDQADETAAVMLGQTLSSAGFAADVGSLHLLASEVVDRIAAAQYDVAVIVMLPPFGSRNARYLCKRLRQSNPDLRIVAALLNGAQLKSTQQRLQDSGADLVVTSLPSAVSAVRNLARRACPAASS